MRISADRFDPHFHPDHREFDVFVDGVLSREASPRRYVITADDDAGEVVEMRRNEHGAVILDPTTGRAKRFTTKAAVRIVRRSVP